MFSIDLESIWIFSVIVRRFLTDDVILPLGAQRPESIARMYTVLTKDACYTLLYIWVNVIQWQWLNVDIENIWKQYASTNLKHMDANWAGHQTPMASRVNHESSTRKWCFVPKNEHLELQGIHPIISAILRVESCEIPPSPPLRSISSPLAFSTCFLPGPSLHSRLINKPPPNAAAKFNIVLGNAAAPAEIRCWVISMLVLVAWGL